MMAVAFFLHGVPDSPAIWRPLLKILELRPGHAFAPAVPGFQNALPLGFAATKDAYVTWAISQLEPLFLAYGPVDLVGHDWGALILQRVAMLRPDLVRSWVAINAVIEPEYRGHRVARIWSTPILGEMAMWLTRPRRIAALLISEGVPADIVQEEAAQWAMADKRRAILRLYRSAKGLSFEDNWALDLGKLASNGALIWGEGDSYVALEVAQRYSKAMDTPLFRVSGASHWAIVQKPADVAAFLREFWSIF